MEKKELVFIPAPGTGHLVSTAKFANTLLDRDERLSITILVIRMPIVPDFETYAQSLAASDTRIRYITLPLADPPSLDHLNCIENYASLVIESHKSIAKDAIIKHVVSGSTPLAGIVLDFFCTPMIDVANELNIPSYLFVTSNASFFGFMHYLPTHYKTFGKPFDISDSDSIIQTYSHPVPSSVLPSVVLNKEIGYHCFKKIGSRFKETQGIIINTFSDLEPYAINALASDKEASLPQIYTVGPVLDLKNGEKVTNPESEKIIKWLDGQPRSSVVFLCFGSRGGFEPAQLMQIAIGLEKSGQRFLWAICEPQINGKIDITDGYSNLSDILPEGFLEKTKDRGMICGWAPQVAVLAHEAIGGFVSHCGWNSILESLWYGVPIVTWPIYAEQQLNAFQMVKELGLAVELKLDYRHDGDNVVLVEADEIENAVISILDDENPVRRRVKDMGEKSRKSAEDGGSSFVSVGRFIERIWNTTKGVATS